MKKRYVTPIAEWPWPLRYTVGIASLLAVFLPVAIVGVAWAGARDGCRAVWRSEAWHMLSVILLAIIFGGARR